MLSPRTGGSVERKCNIGGSVERKVIKERTSGGSACKQIHEKSVKDNSKLSSNDLESGYTIGFQEGLEQGLKQGLEQGLEQGRQDGDASFNDGHISCYMKHVLLPKISNSFTISNLVSSELSSDGKNIIINIKNIEDDSHSHILSITAVGVDSTTFIVNVHKYTFRNGNRTFLHETTHLDFNSLLNFLTTQIDRYFLP